MAKPDPDALPWHAIKPLFEAALEQPPGEREAYVRRNVKDEALRIEVLSLLQHLGESTDGHGFMSEPAAGADGTDRSGQRLGAWEIVRPLGAGGMGEVFEARRADGQYQGRAAIKLLKRGMDSAAVLQRFAQERQALARLQHPHIAALLDAGLSSDGLPFFVMAYVDGRPIDEAARGLALEPRIELFLQLCDAVAYAHRNLLVHRDLKPGNVLVTPEGQVMLLDFGIAKALDPAEDSSDATAGAGRPYTPNYASPEQVRGEPVSTATDIYSLGVLLYLLLTGLRPTGRQASTPAEAARSVLEETPTRPSSLAEPGLADDPNWLATRKRLAGDLDNILLKALEKPIARRYTSVDALAQDLRRYLGGYPVSARAPGAAYVLGKFITRNRSGAALATVALLALIGGMAGTAWQARKTERALAVAQDRLQDIRKLSKDVLLRYGDTVTHLPGGMKIKEQLLTETVGFLDRLLAEAGNEELEFKGEIAMAYARLADIQVANNLNALDRNADGDRNARRALDLFTLAEAGGPKDPFFYMWWGRALKSVALGQRAKGRLDDALAQLSEAAATMERGLQRFPGSADVRSELGSVYFLTGQMQDTINLANRGDREAALGSLARASEIYQALVKEGRASEADAPADVFQLGTIDGARALIHSKRAEVDKAREFALSSVAWQEKALAMQEGNFTMRGGLVNSASNLASMCLDADDAAGALIASSKAWQHLDLLQREEPQNENWPRRRLMGSLHHGRALLANGRAAEALAVLAPSEAGLAAQKQVLRVARTQSAIASALWTLGRGSEAQAKAQEARKTLEALTEQSPKDAGPWLWLGELNARQAEAQERAGKRQLWQQSREAARAAYARAAALTPLAGQHLRISKALSV